MGFHVVLIASAKRSEELGYLSMMNGNSHEECLHRINSCNTLRAILQRGGTASEHHRAFVTPRECLGRLAFVEAAPRQRA